MIKTQKVKAYMTPEDEAIKKELEHLWATDDIEKLHARMDVLVHEGWRMAGTNGGIDECNFIKVCLESDKDTKS
jgi:hypothetical protein